MMPFSLIDERWLPFRTCSGSRRWIAPHEIVGGDRDDEPLAPDWGRADFDAATLEFLIGLLATACAPANIREWAERFRSPPTPDALAECFRPLSAAFVLDGDGPRFMQDLEDFVAEPMPVSGLLIEAPGANTEKNNADLFQKRGRTQSLGLPAAAIALFTLQTYAPSGGAGHRTSLRGGGPLTTLALPPEANDTLWRRLYLNVPDRTWDEPKRSSDIFGWLAPTRTSEGKAAATGSEDVHPLAAFWGVPRRIRLDIKSGEDQNCDLTGQHADRTVATYRTRPWGVSYRSVRHPLSPMRRDKPGSEWLFVHPQPGGLGYRDWIDLALAEPTGTLNRRPADAIVAARDRLRALRLDGNARVAAFGYDMDNMKARGFQESVFPLFLLEDTNANEALDLSARRLVAGVTEIVSALGFAVKDALNLGVADASRLGALREAYFARTREAFFATLRKLAEVLAENPAAPDPLSPVSDALLKNHLRPEALAMFDDEAPLDPSLGRERDIERVIKARFSLSMALNGYGNRGQTLFEQFGLAQPQPKPSKARKKARV